jgi:cation diffusion facilitator family transporter
MVANAGIAVAKFIAFLATGSASTLAESIHSVADTSNQALLLLGGRRARKVADDMHQFGYGRERYFWAFIVAMVLFSLGGIFSIFEGIEKIAEPHELESIGWAVGVLVVSLILEALSFRTAVLESRKVKGDDQTWWSFIRTSRSPELPVVLLEDSGALIGLALALTGVGLAAVTGNPLWDAIGTLCIGILLVLIAVVLTIEMQSLLIGETATQRDIVAINHAVASHPRVNRVIDLRTQHIGPEDLLVAGKIEFDANLTTAEISQAIDEVETSIRSTLPYQVRIYLEPDLFDPTR